jgi:hypothetical protein
MFGVFEDRVADKVELAEKDRDEGNVTGLREAFDSLVKPGKEGGAAGS